MALKQSREGTTTTSLDNLSQFLTTLIGENFFLISNLMPWESCVIREEGCSPAGTPGNGSNALENECPEGRVSSFKPPTLLFPETQHLEGDMDVVPPRHIRMTGPGALAFELQVNPHPTPPQGDQWQGQEQQEPEGTLAR